MDGNIPRGRIWFKIKLSEFIIGGDGEEDRERVIQCYA